MRMTDEKSIYSQLGVSSKKEDVHKALENINKGLFPGAFCKIVEDIRRMDDLNKLCIEKWGKNLE